MDHLDSLGDELTAIDNASEKKQKRSLVKRIYNRLKSKKALPYLACLCRAR